MRRLRVLITNNTLAERAGTELYVRDVALGLLERGHLPIAYSTSLGAVAAELRQATVPVVSDLDALGDPPDLIHGHHHVETMTALLRFPATPAVSFCHGWLPWEELPPRFPRIMCYVAVDDTCRDRLIGEEGIAAERVRVMLNFVDLRRFRGRPPLPPQPHRALVLSNNASEATYLPAVREACARAGLHLDVIGRESGNPCDRPEEILGRYDIVFAKARAALEALATGTAVVLCDQAGVGPLVTAAECDRLRRLNFGIRTLHHPVTPQVLLEALRGYDARDAAVVTRRIRATAGLDRALDELIGLYHEALARHAAAPAPDHAAEARAAAAYLRSVSPALQRQAAQARGRECALLRAQGGHLRAERDELRADCARLRAEAQRFQMERDRLRSERDNFRAECPRLRSARDAAKEERDRLQSVCQALQDERDRLGVALADVHASATLRLRAALFQVPGLRCLSRRAVRGLRWLRQRLHSRAAPGSVPGRPTLVPAEARPAAGGEPRPVEFPPMPVIVGVARSGTTLLRLMLDAHPSLAIPAETGFIPVAAQLNGTGDTLRRSFFQTVTTAVTWPDFNLPAGSFWDALRRIEPFDLAAGLRCFYAFYARRLGKDRWGDKTPLYGRFMRRIEEVLPEARFIHIIRDGRDVALSLRGLWFAPGDSPEALARHWCEEIRATRAQAAGCRRYLEVRYEDLVTRTGDVLRRVCRFLDLPFHAAMEDYHRTARRRLDEVGTRRHADGRVLITKEERLHLHRLTQQLPDRSRIGRWKTDLNREDLRTFEREAGEMLRSLGYETGGGG